MKETILVDLGVITEYLKTGKGKLPTAYEKFTMQIISTTFTTLLASSTFNDSGLESEVKEFIKKYFTVIEVDEASATRSAEVLRKTETTLATALVAGTALAKNLKLLTNTPDVYTGIEGITFAEL